MQRILAHEEAKLFGHLIIKVRAKRVAIDRLGWEVIVAIASEGFEKSTLSLGTKWQLGWGEIRRTKGKQ